MASSAGGAPVATLAKSVVVTDVTEIADAEDVTDTADVTSVADSGIAFFRATVDLVGFRAAFARDPPALAALGFVTRDLADRPATFLPIRFTFAIAAHRTPIPSSGGRGYRVGYQRLAARNPSSARKKPTGSSYMTMCLVRGTVTTSWCGTATSCSTINFW
jgi:hypothetical protein